MEIHEGKENAFEGLTGREKSNAVGTANLIPFSERTEEEKKRICTAGGIASGEARRAKKTFREVFEQLLDSPALSTEDALIEEARQKCPKLTQREAMALAIAAKASQGNIDAARLCIEMVGEKPSDKLDIGNSGDAFTVNIKVVE
jgi:hypothetical protein